VVAEGELELFMEQPVFRQIPFIAALLLLCVLCGMAAGKVAAQSAMNCHAMGTQEAVAPEKMPPPEKLTRIGNAHIAIKTTPEAQMWFDQGLNLLHDFWDYESLRAFEQSVRVDPQCAMCYWGIYQAESFRHSSGKTFSKQALEKAVSLKHRAGKAEKLYIDAAVAAEEADAAPGNKHDHATASKEAQIYQKLVKENPKDLQAKIFLAEALNDGYDDNGMPNAGMKETLTILQEVMKEDPENSAANHYWIHAVEPSLHPEQALHSAEILGRLAPTSGHMVHMPGHIFYRTGDYERAEQAFTASMRAEEQYMKAQNVNVDNDWNYVHNMMYAIANLMEAGKLDEAIAVSGKLKDARGQLQDTLYPWSPRDGMARLAARLPVALRTADWAGALAMLKASSTPTANLPNLAFFSRQLTEFATGMQALEAHDPKHAEKASVKLDAELWKNSQRIKDEELEKSKDKKKDEDGGGALKAMPDALAEPLMKNLSIMSLELRAGLLVEKKQLEEAKKLYAQASREEKALGYHEPPAYMRPVAESEANAMMVAGAWAAAKEAYQRALLERPRSGFPLYGIARANEAAGDEKAATVSYSEFLMTWKTADAELPQVGHARAYVEAHRVTAD
jgi:tetratricopeptide (TPR) repeat protein